MTAGDEASQARHPSGQWWPHPASMLSRMVAELAAEGHPFPRFAGAVLAARGRTGLDQVSFSRLVGMPASLLRGLESGVVDPGQAPTALTQLVSMLEDTGASTTTPDICERPSGITAVGHPPPFGRRRGMAPRPRRRR